MRVCNTAFRAMYGRVWRSIRLNRGELAAFNNRIRMEARRHFEETGDDEYVYLVNVLAFARHRTP